MCIKYFNVYVEHCDIFWISIIKSFCVGVKFSLRFAFFQTMIAEKTLLKYVWRHAFLAYNKVTSWGESLFQTSSSSSGLRLAMSSAAPSLKSRLKRSRLQWLSRLQWPSTSNDVINIDSDDVISMESGISGGGGGVMGGELFPFPVAEATPLP